MKNYKILSENDKITLETVVNEYLNKGYLLIGGMSIENHPIYSPIYSQTVYQIEDTSN